MGNYAKISALLIAVCSLMCQGCTKHITNAGGAVSVPGPRCIVYKMKQDYSRQVPVELSPDRTEVVSFPGIRDIYLHEGFAYPTKLEDGYFLDNRGIGPQVAFLRLTYDEYSKLELTPSASLLMNLILDADPILEMYDCGNRNSFADAEAAMNELILTGKLKQKKRLK